MVCIQLMLPLGRFTARITVACATPGPCVDLANRADRKGTVPDFFRLRVWSKHGGGSFEVARLVRM
jgi:hypothetical protein